VTTIEETRMTSSNKKIGGMKRARKAREDLVVVLQDESNPMFFAKDIELARKYKISRHTMYKIREEYDIPSRTSRILSVLNSLNLSKYTIKELSEKLGIKYQNLYKIIKDNNLSVKPDTPPIQYLREFQKKRKAL